MNVRAFIDRRATVAALALIFCIFAAPPAARAQVIRFTSDADFDTGTLTGVSQSAVHDELQLESTVTSLDHLWFACTARGTLVRVDVETGAILGEYRSAPDGRSHSPSRTAVDRFGNVWAGNRGEAAGQRGSVVQVGLVVGGTRGRRAPDGQFVADASGGYLAPPFAYCTAIDRDGDGLIRTSAGLGDILPWPAGNDAAGGVTGFVHDAADECIRIYQRTPATNVQQVSLDAAGTVWVAGYPPPTQFCQLEGTNGAVLASFPSAAGGFGGCVDAHSMLWSAGMGQGQLLRLDLQSGATLIVPVSQPCGVAVDARGATWTTMYGANTLLKLDAAGGVFPGFPKPTFGGGPFAVAVTPDDDVWVSNSTSNTVTRFTNDGALRKRINVGLSPNGLAIDAHGKVWVTNQSQSTAMRLDPHGAVDGLGAVDLTISFGTAAGPLNYSNMAASSQVRSFALAGTWTVARDGGRAGLDWTRVDWHAAEPVGTHLEVSMRAADNAVDLGSQTWVAVANGADARGRATGRFLQLRVSFARDAQTDATPALFDLEVTSDHPPDCTNARPSVARLWPPDRRMAAVQVVGVKDPDRDVVTCRITRITCDEPLILRGRGLADALGVGTGTAILAATRLGSGNGRIYQIEFVASDGRGGECGGRVHVCVPHDISGNHDCIDDGQNYEAPVETLVSSPLDIQQYPNPFNPRTTIEFVLPESAAVRIEVYDAAGRCVRVLGAGSRSAGPQRVEWDGSDARGTPVASGVYLLTVQAGAWHETRRMLLLK